MTSLEIAIQDAEGAHIAAAHGADRVELCSALGLGGLTPSAGVLEQSLESGIGVHVLVRPRGGGFIYAEQESVAMLADVRLAARMGAAGVVIGALTPDEPGLDIALLERLANAGREVNSELEVTVHRCVDVLLARALASGAGTVAAEAAGEAARVSEQLSALEATRVLTSGGRSRSIDGLDTLLALQRLAAGRFQVQAGGGVRPADIPALRQFEGVHLSARALVRNGSAGPGGGDAQYDVTDPGLVAQAAALVHGAEEAPAATEAIESVGVDSVKSESGGQG